MAELSGPEVKRGTVAADIQRLAPKLLSNSPMRWEPGTLAGRPKLPI